VFTQQADIVSVDLARLVPGAVPQGELGTLAANREACYPALAGEVLVGEVERRADAAVAESTLAQRLVGVKIRATTVAVVQDEVPWPVAGPRVDPIDALGDHRREKALEVRCVHPDVEVCMLPGLFSPDVVQDSPPPPSAVAQFASAPTRWAGFAVALAHGLGVDVRYIEEALRG
jgi:hypothetical protein